MNIEAPNLNILWANLLIEELVRNGIREFSLPPGSRCAPLITAIATHSEVTSVQHFDERGAAFHSVGCGRATGQPAVLITTSGTAVANAWPAVVEASMDRVPMILVTADRPPELRDTGANQTIDQAKIFGPYVRWQIDLPCPNREINPEVLLTAVDQAVYRARSSPRGPVHINCMFREPLAPIPDEEDYTGYLSGLANWRAAKRPFTEYPITGPAGKVESLHQLASTLNEVEQGLVVVGSLEGGQQRDAVRELARHLPWPTLPDIASGLRLGSPHSPMIPYYDALLASPSFAKENSVQAVVHIGGRLISKRLLDYMEKCHPNPYVLVDDHPYRQDPSHGTHLRIDADIPGFCESLIPHLKTKEESPWLSRWRRASDGVSRALQAIENGNLSEPLVARLISQLIPPNHGLFLASSMAIRDSETFASDSGPASVVACNRGALGIDGVLATATGFARCLKRSVTVLMGDLAFLHDLNSLNLVRSIDVPMVIVVLNNNGGGIFSFLPIARFPDFFERYFGTPHHLTFEGAAQMFGVNYVQPTTRGAFVKAYRSATQGDRSTLIEVTTSRNENYDLHVKLLQSITSSLEGA